MRLDTKPGEIVRYLDDNGYDIDRELANEFLIKGNTYRVGHVEVGGWSSEVYLKGMTRGFNTVMFENVDNLD